MKAARLLLLLLILISCTHEYGETNSCKALPAKDLEVSLTPELVPVCNSRDYIIEIDEQFNCNQPIEIKAAWDEWLTIAPLKTTYIVNANINQDMESCHFKVIKQDQSHMPGLAGWTLWFVEEDGKVASARAWVGDFVEQESFHTVSLHEIGHILGLSHSLNPKSIMYYSASNNATILCEDKKNLCKIWDCEVNCSD